MVFWNQVGSEIKFTEMIKSVSNLLVGSSSSIIRCHFNYLIIASIISLLLRNRFYLNFIADQNIYGPPNRLELHLSSFQIASLQNFKFLYHAKNCLEIET